MCGLPDEIAKHLSAEAVRKEFPLEEIISMARALLRISKRGISDATTMASSLAADDNGPGNSEPANVTAAATKYKNGGNRAHHSNYNRWGRGQRS